MVCVGAMVELQAVPWGKVNLALLDNALKTQLGRNGELDPRLPCPDQHLKAYQRMQADAHGTVLLAIEGKRVVGIAAPDVTVYPPGSDFPTYYPMRKGTLKALILGGATADECRCILATLLKGADYYWADEEATGAEVIWPNRDFSIRTELEKIGFALDGYLAFSRHVASESRMVPSLPGLQIRHANVSDQEVVVRLYLEIIEAHVICSPFARTIPAAEPRFRERLGAILKNENHDYSSSFILVAELDGVVVAMAECWTTIVAPDQNFPVPIGRYGYVNSFGVSSSTRRSGIGHVLESAVRSEFNRHGLNSSYLWYSSYNASARNFWPGVGYDAVWVSYQRREDTDQLEG